MLVRGDKGMGLKLERHMITHELIKKRGDDAWEAIFRWVCSMVFKPLKGKIEVDAPWQWEELSTPPGQNVYFAGRGRAGLCLRHGRVLPTPAGCGKATLHMSRRRKT